MDESSPRQKLSTIFAGGRQKFLPSIKRYPIVTIGPLDELFDVICSLTEYLASQESKRLLLAKKQSMVFVATSALQLVFCVSVCLKGL